MAGGLSALDTETAGDCVGATPAGDGMVVPGGAAKVGAIEELELGRVVGCDACPDIARGIGIGTGVCEIRGACCCCAGRLGSGTGVLWGIPLATHAGSSFGAVVVVVVAGVGVGAGAGAGARVGVATGVEAT